MKLIKTYALAIFVALLSFFMVPEVASAKVLAAGKIISVSVTMWSQTTFMSPALVEPDTPAPVTEIIALIPKRDKVAFPKIWSAAVSGTGIVPDTPTSVLKTL